VHYKRASKRTALGQRHKTCVSVLASGSQTGLAHVAMSGLVCSLLHASRFESLLASANGDGCEIWCCRASRWCGSFGMACSGISRLGTWRCHASDSASLISTICEHTQIAGHGVKSSNGVRLATCVLPSEAETLRVHMQLCCCRRG